MWRGYSAGCQQCVARAIARSLDAFNALHPNGTKNRGPLRELIERAMRDVAYPDARRAVWVWWLHDHPEAKAHAS
jgi:hypothetical protein